MPGGNYAGGTPSISRVCTQAVENKVSLADGAAPITIAGMDDPPKMLRPLLPRRRFTERYSSIF